MSWYKQVSDYIDKRLDEFIETFFGDYRTMAYSTGIFVNPSPCCGHNDCFSIAKGMNAHNCFSCGQSGTRIEALELMMGEEAAHEALEEWSGIKHSYNEFDQKRREQMTTAKRVRKIYEYALDHYEQNLRKNKEAMLIQVGTDISKGQRAHTIQTLKDFRIGLSGNYQDFYRDMIEKGFTEEEMNEARKKIWFPEGYFVYPYYDLKGNLKRLNGKVFKYHCMGKKRADGTYSQDCNKTFLKADTHAQMEKDMHERREGHEMTRDGFSRGDKTDAFYFKRAQIKKKNKAILVEGEDDVISTDEAFQELDRSYQNEFAIIGLGGNMGKEIFSSPFLRQFDAVYEAFDNDEAGDGYRKKLNEDMPDVPLYHIDVDDDFSDIDSFLKSAAYQGPQELKSMIDEAKVVETKEFIIEREPKKNIWWLRNRKFEFMFTVEKYNKNSNQLEGTLLTYQNGQLVDKKTSGGLDKMKVQGSLVNPKLRFSEYLHDYYNEVPWEKEKPKRSFWELNDILRFSKSYQTVLKQLAWYLHQADKKEYQENIRQLQNKHSQQEVAEVLKEVNGFQNVQLDPTRTFPRISLSQFFHVTNNDAFFYFSKLVQEGEDAKLVPCLITNKKEEVRLDLLKRKDPQSLLLINNKYELPMEVETAVMDPIEVSVQPYWVDKWKNDQLDEAATDPAKPIDEIRGFINKCYHMPETTAHVVALWVYATYFYMLFKSGFPYLIFTGAKGSGKSTIDTIIYLLSLNAKFALDMSESALFRTINMEGGTLILDEIENLTDKRTVDTSGYAKVLKGGYSDLASVYRTNMDKGGISERFSVFGPKVISNINGIEDVIGDRCIYVRTVSAPEEKLRLLEDPQLYKEERRPEVHSITSRCALSALENFKDVHRIFNDVDSRLETGNARLTQILKPLLTMARLVGGDYEDHLIRFYESEIREVKAEIASGTVEGMLRNILTRVAEELVGIEQERWATTEHGHLYNKEISYNNETGAFEIDAIHLKVLCDETNDDDPVPTREVNRTMKIILGSGLNVNIQSHIKRTSTTLEKEELQRQFDGKRQVRVYKYFLNVKDFVDPAKYSSHISNPQNTDRPMF